jgi:hypothetical protein
MRSVPRPPRRPAENGFPALFGDFDVALNLDGELAIDPPALGAVRVFPTIGAFPLVLLSLDEDG